jgi:integrase
MSESTRPARRRSRRGEGSAYRTSDGRWRAAIVTPDPVTGLPVRRYLSASTERELLERLRGARVRPDAWRSPTVAEYLERWLVTVESRVRPTTHRGYVATARRYVIPALGRRRLAELTPGDVETMTTGLVGRGLKPSTAATARTILTVALSDAERDGLVPRNVARLARPPRIPRRSYVVPDAAGIRRLLELAATVDYGDAFTVALATGLRRGELCALRWSDIRDGELTVSRALVETSDGFEDGEPKSARSRRTITLPSIALEALERRRDRQDAERRAAGRDWQDLVGAIWTDALGRPIRPSTMGYSWRTLRDAAGLPGMRLHDTRHALASVLLGAGMSIPDVAAHLGHSESVLSRTYAHALPGGRGRVVAAVDAALAAHDKP